MILVRPIPAPLLDGATPGCYCGTCLQKEATEGERERREGRGKVVGPPEGKGGGFA